MAIANISKSLVHIQEKFVKRGPYTADVAVPSTATTAAGIVVTGVKVGDFLIAQPTTSSDIVTGQFVTNAYVTAADTVTVAFGGTGTGATKNYTFTVFARPFA